MARIDLERKSTSAWPWVAGLALFVMVVWGVTSLLASPDQEEPTALAETAKDALPTVAIPAPPAPMRDMSAGRNLEDLAPLGEEHVGEVVQVEGEVVATGTTGFWIMTGAMVLRIDSDRLVRKGEAVSLEGTIQLANDEERTDQIVTEVLGRSPDTEAWEVVRTVKVVEAVVEAGDEAPDAEGGV